VYRLARCSSPVPLPLVVLAEESRVFQREAVARSDGPGEAVPAVSFAASHRAR